MTRTNGGIAGGGLALTVALILFVTGNQLFAMIFFMMAMAGFAVAASARRDPSAQQPEDRRSED